MEAGVIKFVIIPNNNVEITYVTFEQFFKEYDAICRIIKRKKK